MKKFLSVLLVVVLSLSLTFSLVACGPKGPDTSTTEGKIEAAAKMSREELIEAAKAETGSFIAYGNTSRIVNAMTNFVKAYGEQLGLTDETAIATSMSDTAIYQLLDSEKDVADNSKGGSMVMIQDGATLQAYREDTNMLCNYVPESVRANVGADDLVPLVQQYINKLFIWNSTGSNVPSFTNVWQLTDAKYAGKIYFKSPEKEQVNKNFLIMLTSPEWSAKLATAYKAYFGKDIVLGDYKNAGYKWVAEFLANANFSINSDTTIAQDLSKETNAGNLGLFVLSKLRDKSVIQANLQVGAWVKDSADKFVKIEPFAGFMYSMYVQVANNGPRPYTAMLFIEYLMQAEGFSPWGDSIGAYSGNNAVAEKEGDQPLSFWKQNLVVENASYILANPSVNDFITKVIENKK